MKIFKVGIVGTGAAADVHFKSLSKNNLFKVKAVCGKNLIRLRNKRINWNVKSYLDTKQMVNSEKLDIVLICNENKFHYLEAKKAVEAGSHIVIEKPIDANVKNSEKLINLCKKNKKYLVVVMQKRYDLATNYLKKLIKKNFLGSIISARVEIFMHRNKKYFSNRKWIRDQKMIGGGITLHHAIHSIDQIIYILDKKIINVSFWKSNFIHKLPFEDTSGGWIKFSDNITASINASVCAHPNLKNRIEIYGKRGSLCLEKDKIYHLPINNNGSFKILKKFKLKELGNYDDVWKNFGLALTKNTKIPNLGNHIINTEKTIKFMYESSLKEKVVYFK